MTTAEGVTAVRAIPLDSIIANEDYQPRARLDKGHVALLAASDPAEWPPLLVTPNEEGGYDVLDGFHRLAAAPRLGLTELRCVVDPNAGYPEAFAANLHHGLPLSLDDRRAYACWLDEHTPDLSLREIGRRCGLSHHTVKAALEGDYGQSAHPDRETADAVKRLVKLAYKAVRGEYGVSKLRGFFGQSDRAQRSAHVRRQLEDYRDEDRARAAAAVTVLGHALIEGARPYVEED